MTVVTFIKPHTLVLKIKLKLIVNSFQSARRIQSRFGTTRDCGQGGDGRAVRVWARLDSAVSWPRTGATRITIQRELHSAEVEAEEEAEQRRQLSSRWQQPTQVSPGRGWMDRWSANWSIVGYYQETRDAIEELWRWTNWVNLNDCLKMKMMSEEKKFAEEESVHWCITELYYYLGQ